MYEPCAKRWLTGNFSLDRSCMVNGNCFVNREKSGYSRFVRVWQRYVVLLLQCPF